MASQWKGWDGIEEWSSMLGDFKLAFTSNSLGHVKIKIELIENDNSWLINAEIKTELGQLEQISRQVKNFFS